MQRVFKAGLEDKSGELLLAVGASGWKRVVKQRLAQRAD
jgi:hypothetical protein